MGHKPLVYFKLRDKEAKTPVYFVHYVNNKLIGELIRGEDGFYYFWPENSQGAWAAPVLLEIADALEKLNAMFTFIIDNDDRI